MIIHNIRITNFKSIYGEQYFDFDDLKGLIKLSGPIGAGKTTLAEAIIWGLFGSVKEHNNPNLIAWNTDSCQIEMNITSKNRNIYIRRNIREQLYITIDGKLISASNKKDYQNILEEYYDVPRLAIEKMCIISFNSFNNSIAAMSPGETKLFLDEIFGFKTFTEYNNEVVAERKTQMNESIKLNAIYVDTENQIKYLNNKKLQQQAELAKSVDITGCDEERARLVEEGKNLKAKLIELQSEYNKKILSLKDEKLAFYNKKMEYATLGKQEKQFVTTFQSGKCPTCGNTIDKSIVEEHRNKMTEYARLYREEESREQEVQAKINAETTAYNTECASINTNIEQLRSDISVIDTKIKTYKRSLELLNENYDDLISEYNDKLADIKQNIDALDIEIGEWNEMNELFTKTLRYNLLETLIPHINSSIQYYINKMEQNYTIKFDQEFKSHIYTDSSVNEISYKDLSTGQRKSLDVAIIFGILQNVISNVKFNICILDELFSNLDTDARNIMLSILKETIDDKTIFVINHAEMNDDFFDHKIRVGLNNKKIIAAKRKGSGNSEKPVVVKASSYTKVF